MAKKKVVKKRGVKPRTKRGLYKKAKIKVSGPYSPDETLKLLKIKLPNDWLNKSKATIDKDYHVSSIGSASNLCGQLEEAIRNLEIRISNSIAKINSLM